MSNEKFLLLVEVMQITGLGRSSIFQRTKNGTFPPLIKVHARKVVWTESSIQKWISDLAKNSNPQPKLITDDQKQTSLPQKATLANCSVTTRIFNGTAELVLENGSDEPCFVRGRQELKIVMDACINLLDAIEGTPIPRVQTFDKTKSPTRMLRLPEVMHRVGLKKSSIYDGIQKETFPKPIKLSRRAVCWPESQITDYLQGLLAAPAGIEPASTP